MQVFYLTCCVWTLAAQPADVSTSLCLDVAEFVLIMYLTGPALYIYGAFESLSYLISLTEVGSGEQSVSSISVASYIMMFLGCLVVYLSFVLFSVSGQTIPFVQPLILKCARRPQRKDPSFGHGECAKTRRIVAAPMSI